jgi:hypothetical protein
MMHQVHQSRPRHLHAVPDNAPAALPVPAPPVGSAAASARRVTLTPWQRMEVEQAREMVCMFEASGTADLTAPRLAFQFGRLHGMAANLLDVLDAITTTT